MHSQLTPAYSPNQLKLLSWIVFFITPLSGVCVDVYVPSLPHVATALAISASMAQLTIPAYTFGLAFSQFIAGPITDSIGRKKTMLVGALLQIACILILVLIQNIGVMIVMRVIQGIVVSLVVVSNRAILIDIFEGQMLRKKLNTMTICWAMGPIIAPFIGGYLQFYFNWEATFYFMLAYTVVALVLIVFLLHETINTKTKLSIGSPLSNYRKLSTDAIMMTCLLLAGICASYIVLFNLAASFFIQSEFSFSSIQYGRIALLIGVAWWLGNSFSRITLGISFNRKCYFSLLTILLVLVMMLITEHLLAARLSPIIVATFIIVACSAFIFPELISLALKNYSHLAGTANAFFFGGTWLVSSIVIWIGSMLSVDTIAPLVCAYLIIAIIAFLLFHFLLAKKSPA